jgi:hypothetical protein
MEDRQTNENVLTIVDLNTKYDWKKKRDHENYFRWNEMKMGHIFYLPKISVL